MTISPTGFVARVGSIAPTEGNGSDGDTPNSQAEVVGCTRRISHRSFDVSESSRDSGCGCSYLCQQFCAAIRGFFGRLGQSCRGRSRQSSCFRPACCERPRGDGNASQQDAHEGMPFATVMQHASSLFFGQEMLIAYGDSATNKE